MKRISLALCLLFYISLPVAAQPGADTKNDHTSYVICFPTYKAFVNLSGLLKNANPEVTLAQYLPSAARKITSDEICFLEWLPTASTERQAIPEQLSDNGVRSYMLGLPDIISDPGPRREHHLTTGQGEEVVFKFRDKASAPALFERAKQLLVNLSTEEAQLLGPQDLEVTDEIRIRLNSNLADQWRTKNLDGSQAERLSRFERRINSAGVIRISPAQHAELRNATTSWVIQSNVLNSRPIFDPNGANIRGRRQIIGIIDESIDSKHCFFSDSSQQVGPQHRKLIRYYPNPAEEVSLHGTFVAGIAAGAPVGDPFNPRNGQAPDAQIAFDSVWSFGAPGIVPTLLYNTLEEQYKAGAQIYSNSWGESPNQTYSPWSYDVDRFTHDHESVLVLFATSNEGSIGTPDNARNALAVGASKQSTFQNAKGRGADGPTRDYRRKPEVLAPGCGIYSAKPETSDQDNNCAIILSPLEKKPDTKETRCATSWAAPAVAGAAALAREYLYARSGADPSGALLKAFLLNSTEDMNAVIGKDQGRPGWEYPNDSEGWGRIQLQNVIGSPTASTLYFDILNCHGFPTASTNLTKNYRFQVTAGSLLKVTLAFTDHPPAATEKAKPVVNDLNLLVKQLDCAPGQACFFIGNDFQQSGAISAKRMNPTGADELNNVERVIIKTEKPEYCISVVGEKIINGPQGYALVVTGKDLLYLSESSQNCP